MTRKSCPCPCNCATEPPSLGREDVVRAFLNACAIEGSIVVHPRGEARFSDLYTLYKAWNTGQSEPVGPNPFGTVLTALGFRSRKGTNGTRLRTGIHVKNP